MVRARRLQRRYPWTGTRVRPRAHEASRLGTPQRATKWEDSRRDRMKAVRVLEYGGQLVFDEVPTPTIAADEVLVKVTSTAVNHVDLVKASGVARQVLPIDLPWIPGHEFSGVVDQIALWMKWSGLRFDAPVAAHWFPRWPLQRRGHR